MLWRSSSRESIRQNTMNTIYYQNARVECRKVQCTCAYRTQLDKLRNLLHLLRQSPITAVHDNRHFRSEIGISITWLCRKRSAITSLHKTEEITLYRTHTDRPAHLPQSAQLLQHDKVKNTHTQASVAVSKVAERQLHDLKEICITYGTVNLKSEHVDVKNSEE